MQNLSFLSKFLCFPSLCFGSSLNFKSFNNSYRTLKYVFYFFKIMVLPKFVLFFDIWPIE